MERNTMAEPQAHDQPLDDASISELTKRLSDQSTALARKEIELAKAEVEQKGKRLGLGAGAFGAAGVVGLFAVGALTAAVILALDKAVDAWLAGADRRRCLRRGGRRPRADRQEAGRPGDAPVPEQAIESTKADIDAVKAGAKEGRGG